MVYHIRNAASSHLSEVSRVLELILRREGAYRHGKPSPCEVLYALTKVQLMMPVWLLCLRRISRFWSVILRISRNNGDVVLWN